MKTKHLIAGALIVFALGLAVGISWSMCWAAARFDQIERAMTPRSQP
jgi:hypothetical protein